MERISKKALELALAVYRVTELFPREEILRIRIRERALGITDGLIKLFNLGLNPHLEKLDADFEVLFAYFEIAQAQNWVKPQNFKVLIHYYRDLQEEINVARGSPRFLSRFSSSQELKKEEVEKKKEQIRKKERQVQRNEAEEVELTPRQQDIFNYLQSIGRGRMEEISRVFSAISKRTLRRDLENLLKMGYIKRLGFGTAVLYETHKKG